MKKSKPPRDAPLLFDTERLTAHETVIVAADPSENKHQGNPQSDAAHDRVVHSKTEKYKRIMTYLKTKGGHGATSKEIAAAFGVQLNCLSGRFSELKTLEWIEESGERRNGAAVLVIKRREGNHE